jgi:CubicO group peptidase (beta-lactamase class C family)
MNIWLKITIAVTVLLVTTFVVLFISYPAPYVIKTLSKLDADVSDMYYFPSSKISHDTNVYYFKTDLQNEKIEQLFQQQSKISDLEEFLTITKTSSFIVIENDTIVYEKYLNGYTRDSLVTSFSIAKSFDSTLVGIAIDEGYIDSENDPITNYIPELLEHDPDFSNISIEDLLLMSSGIRYHETGFLNGDDAKTYYWPDLRDLAINKIEVEGQPQSIFHYNNYHPLLIGIILERATGIPVSEYMESRLWSRIGTEFDAGWSLDDTGFEKMESGINARAIDFAKFGKLILDYGTWEGEEIVSSNWVTLATSPQPVSDYETYYSEYSDYIFSDGNGYYKYFWWGIQRENGYDILAEGNLGQFIYISPGKKLIILRFGEKYGSLEGSYPWIKSFYEFTSDYK